MASEAIGAVIGAITGTIYAVINPDEDRELDNPRWLLIQAADKEPMALVRIPRGEYMGALSMDDLARIVERLRVK